MGKGKVILTESPMNVSCVDRTITWIVKDGDKNTISTMIVNISIPLIQNNIIRARDVFVFRVALAVAWPSNVFCKGQKIRISLSGWARDSLQLPCRVRLPPPASAPRPSSCDISSWNQSHLPFELEKILWLNFKSQTIIHKIQNLIAEL